MLSLTMNLDIIDCNFGKNGSRVFLAFVISTAHCLLSNNMYQFFLDRAWKGDVNAAVLVARIVGEFACYALRYM